MKTLKKSHYELIAFCVRNGRDKRDIALHLAAELSVYPNFDTNKFLEACGVEMPSREPLFLSKEDRFDTKLSEHLER